MDAYLKYPLGFVRVEATDKGVSLIEFVDQKHHDNVPAILIQPLKELSEYFEGKRKEFTFDIDIKGTAFQISCWKALMEIEYAQTASYKDIAIALNKPTASRAVGGANNKNKLPIVIPCHRVVGSNNKLVGYRGGLSIKKFLLDLEKENRA